MKLARLFSLILLLVFLAVPALAGIQATIVWTDVVDEDSYKVERSDAGVVGPFVEIGQTAQNVTTLFDTLLVANTVYCWRIIASNSFGDSAPSPETCGATNVPTQPGAPTIVITVVP